MCDSCTPFMTTSKDKSLQIAAQSGGGRYSEAFTHMPQGAPRDVTIHRTKKKYMNGDEKHQNLVRVKLLPEQKLAEMERGKT